MTHAVKGLNSQQLITGTFIAPTTQGGGGGGGVMASPSFHTGHLELMMVLPVDISVHVAAAAPTAGGRQLVSSHGNYQYERLVYTVKPLEGRDHLPLRKWFAMACCKSADQVSLKLITRPNTCREKNQATMQTMAIIKYHNR